MTIDGLLLQQPDQRDTVSFFRSLAEALMAVTGATS
jgi:hypothetical protein